MSDLWMRSGEVKYDGNVSRRSTFEQASNKEILAAVLNLGGVETVDWCEEHRALEAVEEDPGFCWRYDGDKPCRIVSKIIVDYPTEEE